MRRSHDRIESNRSNSAAVALPQNTPHTGWRIAGPVESRLRWPSRHWRIAADAQPSERAQQLVERTAADCSSLEAVEARLCQAFPKLFVYRGAHHVAIHARAGHPRRLVLIIESEVGL